MKKNRHLLRVTSLGLLLVVSILAAAAFSLLYRGVAFESFVVADVRVDQFSLRLQEKLVLEIDRISVPERAGATPPAKERGSGANVKAMRWLLIAVDLVERWFARIDINNIVVAGHDVQFSYRETEQGRLLASGPLLNAGLEFHLAGETLVADIKQLALPSAGIAATGWIQVDTVKRRLLSGLSVNLADTLSLSLQIEADRRQLSFSGHGEHGIKDIAPVVDLFGLKPPISPWISEYLEASEVSLRAIRGVLPYSDPAKILQTLYAEVLVKDPEYSFAQGLEPALAPRTRLVFERGVLGIYPEQATFYGQSGGDTHVDIDFNNGRFLLTVYVRTRAQASGGILALLDHYGIPFPFEQVSGLTDSELDLTIDLATKKIEATGQFFSQNTVFRIGSGQQRVHVERLNIGLRTTVVLLREIELSIPNLLAAAVDGVFDAASKRGEMDISVHRFSAGKAGSALALRASRESPLHLDYEFRPAGDQVQVAASNWFYGGMGMRVEAFSIPFDPARFAGSVQAVRVDIPPAIAAQVGGSFQAREPYADLAITLLKLGAPGAFGGLSLEQPGADIRVRVADSVAISTAEPVKWSVQGKGGKMGPSVVNYRKGEFVIDRTEVELGAMAHAGIAGRVNPGLGLARLQLDDISFSTARGAELLAVKAAQPLDIAWETNFLKVRVPRFGIVFEGRRNGLWTLDVDDLAKLYPHSSVLQKAQLDEGALRVSSRDGGPPYRINGVVKSPFGLIVEPRDGVLDKLRLNGSYDGSVLKLGISDKAQINWANGVWIKSKDIGYSWPALKRLISSLPPAPVAEDAAEDAAEGDKGGVKVSLQAKRSFIDIDDSRRLPLDALSARWENGAATMNFYHSGGFGTLDFTDGKLYLAGKNFKDSFFDDVVTLAEFEGGRMEFRVEGALNDLQAVFRIRNTIIKDYKHLNNMLAFINTVPGLITFNPPGYSNHGLPAKETYAGIAYKEGIIELKSLKIDSDELTLMGGGVIDLKKEKMDMDFNLVSGAKKSLNRIPLLGYILTGGEKKPTISLKMQGDLYDPEISNTAFREVVTYPFQVLKRTVLLPVHIAGQVQGHQADRKAGEEGAQTDAAKAPQ